MYYQGYGNRYRVPLVAGALIKSCRDCLYIDQNIDKTVTILRFRNILIAVLTTDLN